MLLNYLMKALVLPASIYSGQACKAAGYLKTYLAMNPPKMLMHRYFVWWCHFVVWGFIITSTLGFVHLPLPSLTGKNHFQAYYYYYYERSTTVIKATPVREEIRYVAGRRALLLHPAPSKQPNNNISHPPLVILGGMAQSIASWELHLPYFAKDRSVLIYECLGQGPYPPEEICPDLDTNYADVSLKRQGLDFWSVVNEAFFTPGSYYHDSNDGVLDKAQVDVVGFSFGGRVAMAAALSQSNRIRKLHLTGMGAERDEYANVILSSWKDMLSLQNENKDADSSGLRAFAWSIILATYSEHFLGSVGAARIQTWVDIVCQFNTQRGLRAILMQTHAGEEGQWTPASMAGQMKGSIESYRLVVGSKDKMASTHQVQRLDELLGGNESYRVIENCGHAVPFEAMRLWREDVMKYLT